MSAKHDVLNYLMQKYGIGHVFTLSEAMLEGPFAPEKFGEAISSLVAGNMLVLSVGTPFSSVTTKRGICDLNFDVTDDWSWNRWKRELYPRGFTGEMREKIVAMHSKIPFTGKFRKDYARIRSKSEWNPNKEVSQ